MGIMQRIKTWPGQLRDRFRAATQWEPGPESRLARFVRIGSVLLVAVIAAVISYTHIYHLAITHGQGRLSSALLALCVDGVVVVATTSMMRAAGWLLWWARCMLILSVGATLAANVAYGIPFGRVGALISGWPAVAFFGCAELGIGMARKARVPGPEPAAPKARRPRKADPVDAELEAMASGDGTPEQEARDAYRASVASGTPLSPRKLAAAYSKSRTWGASRIREVEAAA